MALSFGWVICASLQLFAVPFQKIEFFRLSEALRVDVHRFHQIEIIKEKYIAGVFALAQGVMGQSQVEIAFGILREEFNGPL